MDEDVDREVPEQKLDRNGVRGIVVWFAGIILQFIVLLASAGKVMWINAWLFFALCMAYEIAVTVVLVRKNPAMLNERGKLIRKDTRAFDKVYAVLWIPMILLASMIIGFDAVRFGWSSMPPWMVIIGIIGSFLGFWLGLSAMKANAYFETTVRIQKDRAQQVVSCGPYEFVRHPGYASLIISLLSMPLILGSWWGFLPALAIMGVVIARTALEDRTLKAELPGYPQYASNTRYRLVPPVW